MCRFGGSTKESHVFTIYKSNSNNNKYKQQQKMSERRITWYESVSDGIEFLFFLCTSGSLLDCFVIVSHSVTHSDSFSFSVFTSVYCICSAYLFCPFWMNGNNKQVLLVCFCDCVTSQNTQLVCLKNLHQQFPVCVLLNIVYIYNSDNSRVNMTIHRFLTEFVSITFSIKADKTQLIPMCACI